MFKPGDKAIFTYPLAVGPALSGYSDHSGQIVTIGDEKRYDDDANLTVSQRLYQIKADDNWVGHAFEDELKLVEE